METKPRILYLQKILLERTDEENPLSTTQLINILNDEYGNYHCEIWLAVNEKGE